jgi:hypothetical protein
VRRIAVHSQFRVGAMGMAPPELDRHFLFENVPKRHSLQPSNVISFVTALLFANFDFTACGKLVIGRIVVLTAVSSRLGRGVTDSDDSTRVLLFLLAYVCQATNMIIMARLRSHETFEAYEWRLRRPETLLGGREAAGTTIPCLYDS